MNKNEIMLALLERCKKKIEEQKNGKMLKNYECIINILNKPDAFEYIDFSTAVNILLDLGYSKEDALKIYGLLIN